MQSALQQFPYFLFNDALNTFYLWLYSIRHMINNHSDSERENLLPPLHRLLFSCSTKGSFTHHDIYCPVYGMVHVKDPLLLTGKSSPCSGSYSLSE